MAIIIGSQFDLKATLFNFSRDYFESVELLNKAPITDFPDHFITNVAGTLYQLTKANGVWDDSKNTWTVSPWKKLEFGDKNALTTDGNGKIQKNGVDINELTVTNGDTTVSIEAKSGETDGISVSSFNSGRPGTVILNGEGLRQSTGGSATEVWTTNGRTVDISGLPSEGTVAAIQAKLAGINDTVKGYVDSQVGGLALALVFKGRVPEGGLPANPKVGDTYIVGTAGDYAGETCEVGDTIICISAKAGETAAKWLVVHKNLDGAVTKGDELDWSGKLIVGTAGNMISGLIGTEGQIIQVDASGNPTYVDPNYYQKSEIDSNLAEKQREISNLESKIGYYECSSEASNASKTIAAPNYVLGNGGSMKVKMTNANSANNATLNINSTGAKALYYSGERASANNSWEAGETIEVYYDGVNYYANNVSGGSGGDGVFDITAKTGDVYATLGDALTVANSVIPANKKKGGMSIKFVQGTVQNSDNKYVQYRLMANTFSTTVANWQGVDNEPTIGSNNLVKSGGVADSINKLKNSGYFYAGIATPTTNPGTPDGPVFYFAVSDGTYSNFGNLYNAKHELSVFSWNNDSWSKESLATSSDLTIIDALPAIYATTPSQDIGADGDYALFLFTTTLNRIYKKANGVWERFEDYDRVLICAGNRVFYRKNNDETILFTEITAPIIDFEILNEGKPSQSANEGDYALALNVGGTNNKRLYIYNNATWKEAYSYSHFISPIFRNGNDCYKIYPGPDNTISNVTKIINNSAVDALQKEIGDLQKETSIEKLVVTASGTIVGTGASDKNFYLKVTPLTTYTLRFKAQYTGALGLYASTDGTDLIGLFFEVKDTDFTSEYVATITTPDNCNVIRTRTWLANAVIDYISLYSVQPLNVVVKDIEEKQKANQSDWTGKVISTYGDSVTALNGGDFNYPYDESAFGYKWALRVANYFNASSVKNRGIGGQRFSWHNNGGSISWVNTLTGEYVNRNDSYNYDNYEGNVEIPSSCTPIRGALSSWLRITSMYPESIKDTIDVILVMAHNDAGLDTTTKLQFLTGDNTDPEWANSTYYQTYNGDYNINTVRGGIASTIMKLQAWMPNAVIVLMTPISGKGTQGELNPELISGMAKIADIVKEMHNLMSIPCIDVYGTCGINGLNRTLYITDTIHPYSENGSKMVARAVIGGLKSIIPNM